jgi:hypothetical protein
VAILWPGGRPEHRRRRVFAGRSVGLRSVGPRGFEPRTCGLRVWCERAGQSVAGPLSSPFPSQSCPSFPIVSRSFTGMRRGRLSISVVMDSTSDTPKGAPRRQDSASRLLPPSAPWHAGPRWSRSADGCSGSGEPS